MLVVRSPRAVQTLSAQAAALRPVGVGVGVGVGRRRGRGVGRRAGGERQQRDDHEAQRGRRADERMRGLRFDD